MNNNQLDGVTSLTVIYCANGAFFKIRTSVNERFGQELRPELTGRFERLQRFAFFSLWTTRNDTIHGHDLKTQNQSRHRRLRAEMELLHTKRDSVLRIHW